MKRLTFLAGLIGPLFACSRKSDMDYVWMEATTVHPTVMLTATVPRYLEVITGDGRVVARIEESAPDTVVLKDGTMEEAVLILAVSALHASDRDRKHGDCKTMADWFRAMKKDNEEMDRRLRERLQREQQEQRQKSGA